MRWTSRLVVTGMLLAFAAPAAAQGRSSGGGEREAVFHPFPFGLRAPDRGSRPAAVEAPEGIVEARPAPGADRIVGSLPVFGFADVELGLMSIVHAPAKELDRRRTDLAREVRTPVTRVAAVGLSLHF